MIAAAVRRFGGGGMAGSVARLTARAMSTSALLPAAKKLESNFGISAFGPQAEQLYVSGSALDAIRTAVATDEPIDAETCDQYAAGLKLWATKRGATHYTHIFHPLTSDGAQKHEAMMKRKADGSVQTSFRGKNLVQGEADASSFPNGGLRNTACARGYTVWDPTSPPYVVNHGNGATLFLPSMFMSWTGDALDFKIPVLRSAAALDKQGCRLFKAMRVHKVHKTLTADVGAEQEFFLIDREFYLRRPDIMATGRSLVGAPPAKGQSLSDQYFGDLPTRMLQCIFEAEVEMWQLGIPQTTRHREVSPGQYEIAPVFSGANIACDQNRLVMDVLNKVARNHNLKVLFHEKPFAHLNGSGKHNNWSVGTNAVGSLFDPGADPVNNRLFLASVIAMIRACDMYPELLRVAVSSCSNDHRLGGHEAPPAIMSVYLGDVVNYAVEQFANQSMTGPKAVEQIQLGVLARPKFVRDATDRNRTSPIAFTGNKFEFRAVGSSQAVARSTYTLNTILAESLGYLADEIDKATAGKPASEFADAVDDVLRATYKKHRRIVFEGDNYTTEWANEAERRGLPNLLSTADALPLMNMDKNIALFEAMGVMTKREIEAHQAVFMEEYIQKLMIEGAAMLDVFNSSALPAGIAAQTRASAAVLSAHSAGIKGLEKQAEHATAISSCIGRGLTAAGHLENALDELHSMAGQPLADQCQFAKAKIDDGLEMVRVEADGLEGFVSRDEWTLPTYNDMLFVQD